MPSSIMRLLQKLWWWSFLFSQINHNGAKTSMKLHDTRRYGRLCGVQYAHYLGIGGMGASLWSIFHHETFAEALMVIVFYSLRSRSIYHNGAKSSLRLNLTSCTPVILQCVYQHSIFYMLKLLTLTKWNKLVVFFSVATNQSEGCNYWKSYKKLKSGSD